MQETDYTDSEWRSIASHLAIPYEQHDFTIEYKKGRGRFRIRLGCFRRYGMKQNDGVLISTKVPGAILILITNMLTGIPRMRILTNGPYKGLYIHCWANKFTRLCLDHLGAEESVRMHVDSCTETDLGHLLLCTPVKDMASDVADYSARNAGKE